MNQETIPDNNLSVYLQKYNVKIFDDKKKSVGNVLYTTVGVIPSNQKEKRVWSLNLTGYLKPNVDKYNIVYDFSKVEYKYKDKIIFQNIVSGTFTICGRVLDASKIVGFDYKYNDEESTLTIGLDTSKWDFRLKKDVLFNYDLTIDDDVKGESALQKNITNHWNKNGMMILRVWDSNLIFENEYAQFSLSSLQKNAVINGIYLVSASSPQSGILYNTWDKQVRIDCSFMFNANTRTFDKKIHALCEGRDPDFGPPVTSCKCSCRGPGGLVPSYTPEPPNPVTLGTVPKDEPYELACTCGGGTFADEPNPDTHPDEAAKWRADYLDYYKNLPGEKIGLPAVFPPQSQCCFRYIENMMRVRDEYLKWLFDTNNPGVEGFVVDGVNGNFFGMFQTFTEIAYGGDQTDKHAGYFYARCIGDPNAGNPPPKEEVDKVKNMPGFTELPWICIDNVPTCDQATGGNGCQANYKKEWNYPNVWANLPELIFTVYEDVYNAPQK